jgi:predicted  nucleic acid-binding Zn-ribbon protein
MHPELESLLELQDLKMQRADLLEQSESRNVEEEVFHMSVDEALEQLDEKIAAIEEALPPVVRGRYRRLLGSRGRFVVPVINGTCFGCFVSIPTAVASVAERNEGLRHCDNCGRFLYLVASDR